MKKICTWLVLCGLAAFTTGCDKGKPAATGSSTSTTPAATSTTPDTSTTTTPK